MTDTAAGAAASMARFATNPAVATVLAQFLLGDKTHRQVFGSRDNALTFIPQILTAFGVSPTTARIVRGATEVFSEQGVAATSVEHVLRAAKVSRRTFYKHFESKEQLVDVLFITTDALLTGVFEASWERDGDAIENLRRSIRAFIRGFALAGHLLRALFVEALRPGTRLQQIYSERLDNHVAMAKPEMDRASGFSVDPRLVRSLLLALQVTVTDAGVAPETSAVDVSQLERRLCRVFEATLLADDPRITPLPVA